MVILNNEYFILHQWISKNFGKANCCENNKTHKSKKYEWANISGIYTKNRSDYKMLCVSCHRRMDIKSRKIVCVKGHYVLGDNLYINSKNYRECRICRKDSIEKYNKIHPVFKIGFARRHYRIVCKKGHYVLGNNVYIQKNKTFRQCRICKKEWRKTDDQIQKRQIQGVDRRISRRSFRPGLGKLC